MKPEPLNRDFQLRAGQAQRLDGPLDVGSHLAELQKPNYLVTGGKPGFWTVRSNKWALAPQQFGRKWGFPPATTYHLPP
jgi:hypothetical protein